MKGKQYCDTWKTETHQQILNSREPFCLFILLFLMIGQFSCYKTDTPVFRAFNTGTRDELSCIYFWDEQNGMVAGGQTWTRGMRLTTSDGGLNWKRDSLYDKQIFSLTRGEDQNVYGVGIDRQIYRFNPGSTEIIRFGGYKFYRGVLATDAGQLWIVGGESFGTGYLDRADLQKGSLENRITIDRELDAICALDSNHWIIAGFGTIMITADAGVKWDTLVERDHWRDVCKIAKGSAIAVGISGNIIRTRDYGQNWTTVRRGANFLGPGLPLRTVAFSSPTHGIAAGENGAVLRTHDGGDNWIRLEGLPKVNYLDIQVQGDHYWLCGSDGTVIRVE